MPPESAPPTDPTDPPVTAATREQIEAAFEQGKTSGAAAEPPGPACPYEPRTVLCTWWLRGYTRGRSIRAGAPAL